MNPKYSAYVDTTPEQFSRSQKSFLNLAMKTAEASECTQRHGAVVVKSGSVLSIGLNKWRNDAALADEMFASGKSTDISVHAEIDALSRVRNPAGSVLYIARVNKQGEPMMSKPCNACAKAIEEAGITKVVYTS
ncbi:MAG: hypothetical protein H9W81_12345 [Enterococcus sp.]|nr:hypothetical protein [Enterococcus sp.]